MISEKILPGDLYELTHEDEIRFAEEAALGMTTPNHPVLIQNAGPVAKDEISSEYIRQVIERLRFVAKGQRQGRQKSKNRRTLVGLAAPQIGEPLRIVLIDTKIGADRKRPGKLTCLINPEIIWRSRETEEGREGCFSAGPVWGLVRRSVAVKVRALTPSGRKVEHIFEGFTARIAQHEIDHLRGVRFPELIRTDRKRHWVHTEELELYTKHIRHWHRPCTLARWEAYKNPKV